MKSWCVLLVCVTLSACANAPIVPRPDNPSRAQLFRDDLFRDDLFTAPTVRISPADVFALSEEMRRYVATDIDDRIKAEGRQRGLFDALYDKNQLKLDYDAEVTRSAAETFAAKAGNCLSLVIMTAAFAKEIGVPVRYQKVLVDEAWSRSGDIYFSAAHVNLTLGRTEIASRLVDYQSSGMVIDFLGAEDIRGYHLRPIKENTVIAMYMNNHAAEALARGNTNDAYWWARAAIAQDPLFVSAYNTLGVVYRRHGNLPEAERVLSHVLKVEPDNLQVMSNLALVFDREGRVEEASTLTRRLEQLQPYPPFYFFNQGLAAMRKGDFTQARTLFAREVARDAYYHEFHFWLAVADANLGDYEEARSQLAMAMETSVTRKEHELYAAKLDRIRASHPQ